ncbi:MAG: acetone carboxylase subunit gamma, partial [Candidatus Dadabacteria bacterium]
MAEYDIHEIEQLIDGQLPWSRVQEIMKAPKDPDRFDKWIQILQRRVPWNEKILLPLTPALFIVAKDGQRIVKCRCGHEFGDYRVNWKLSALIHVRDDADSLAEIYRGREQPDPTWVQIREYICPGCGTQL